MNITENIILDLIPLYQEGEVSEDTYGERFFFERPYATFDMDFSYRNREYAVINVG